MALSIREVFNFLDEIVKFDIGDLYQNIGSISKDVPRICSSIISAIDSFIVESCDLSDPVGIHFLNSNLPILVEVFLRRQTNE